MSGDRTCFDPFEKGGYGGFAPVLLQGKSKSPSIPLFQRGKTSPQFSAISHQPSAHSPQRGYTLIEVLVAFAVLALALTLLLGTLSGATRQVRWAADAGRAALHAQSLLAEVGVGEALQPGRRDGDFEDGRYRWTLDVAPFTDPLLPPQPTSDPFAPQLMQLRLAVEWGDGTRAQRMQLDSLRLVQPDVTEGGALP